MSNQAPLDTPGAGDDGKVQTYVEATDRWLLQHRVTPEELAAHVDDATAAHAASAINVEDASDYYNGDNVETILEEIMDARVPGLIAEHTGDPTAAHAASAIAVVDAGNNYTATDVEGVLAEIAPQLGGGGGGGGVTDHGALTGLADNDHPQYELVANHVVPWVFENPLGSSGRSVYCGKFWPAGDEPLGLFVWEAWVCPLAADPSAKYWISEGYGGGHSILCGPVNGNTWNGSSTVSVGSSYTPEAGEWIHSMMSWDGNFLRIYTNGVVTGITDFTGPRRSQNPWGRLYLGGSDHANLEGRIASVRAFETAAKALSLGNRTPYFRGGNQQLDAPFTPQRNFSPYVLIDFGEDLYHSMELPAQFCMDFTNPWQQLIPDLSPGFGGRQHHGTHIDANRNANGRPVGIWVQDPNCPARLDQAVVPTRTLPSPPATPAGARIFDSFTRQNRLRVWANCGLGNTEAGSLGVLPWSSTSAGPVDGWGILDGRAVSQVLYFGWAWVENGQADMDVRVDRFRGNHERMARTGLIFRKQPDNENNYWYVDAYGPIQGGTIAFGKTGAESSSNSVTAPSTNWTTLRVVASGTTITVYVDDTSNGWTQVGQLTGQTYLQTTGTQCGLYSGWEPSTERRWDNFTVMAA